MTKLLSWLKSKKPNHEAIIDSNRVYNEHAQKRRFICPCGERFTYPTNFTKHIKTCQAYYEQEVKNE